VREEYGEIPGGTITDYLCLRGQMQGAARVASGGRLDIFGQVSGSLTIDEGGRADVYGQVSGDVVNRGALKLAGMIVGELHDESGQAQIEPGAVIIGRG
jgi:hypothetical protein